MNKFKKVMLGALSVLTLGLFAVVGTKVDAAIVTESGSNSYCSYTVNASTAKWDFTKYAGGNSGIAFSSSSFFGLNYSETNISMKEGGFVQFAQNSVLSIPVPSDAVGTVTFNFQSNKTDGSRYLTIASDTEYASNISYTVKDDDTVTNFNNKQVENGYLKIKSIGGAISAYYVQVSLTTGEYINLASYDVVFNYNYDGADPASSTSSVKSGNLVTKPTDPERDGYSFLGWYTKNGSNNDWGDEFNFDTPITSPINLYAKWASNSDVFVVTFKNGDTVVDTINVAKNSAIGNNIPVDQTKFDKTFDGWYNGDEKCTTSTVITGDTIFTAKFADMVLTSDFNKLSPNDIKNAMTSSDDEVNINNFAVKDETDKIRFASNAIYFGSNGNTSTKYIKFRIPAYSSANISITGTASSKTMALNVAGVEESLKFESTATTHVKNVSNDSSSAKVVYLYRNGGSSVYISDITVTITTASVFAEKNTSGDTLKFVGTLTGITDLTKVGSIELILTLNGTATAKQIFLKTCYTSVTGLSENAPECGVATNTYYTIYRISGVSGLKGTITKQLKVTFTDGSTTTSELTEIVLK